jgi:hypothetical protein
MDLHKLFRGRGYLITESEFDTQNIECRRGHIYHDGQGLVASLDNGTRAECMALRKLGEPVADGDFGELSIRFPVTLFKDVARIMLPRQASLAKAS